MSSSLATDEQVNKRLENPMNLMNRMASLRENANKRQGAMGLFGINRGSNNTNLGGIPLQSTKEVREIIPSFTNPFAKLESKELVVIPKNEGSTQEELPKPSDSLSVEDILSDSQAKIKLGHAHDAAISLLTESLTKLRSDLDRVDTEKLPSVISAASKVVEGIRRERNEVAKSGKDKEVHYHFYTPEQKKIEQYDVIDV